MPSLDTEDQPTPLSIRDLLKIRDFRLLWFSQSISTFGNALTMLAVILLLNELSGGSSSIIATLMIVIGIPTATLGLVAGAFVDRWSRKRTLLVCDAIRAAIILTFAGIVLLMQPPLWVIFLLAFIEAAVGTFFNPARMALTPIIVPEHGLMTANSLAQLTNVVFGVLGTAAAGVLVGTLDIYWIIFAIDGLTFLLSALFISRIKLVEAIPEASQAQSVGELSAEIIQQLKEGVSVIRQSRLIIGVLVGATVTMLGLGATNVLLPLLVVNDLQVSEAWFGAIELSQTVGMILSALAVTAIAARLKPTRIIEVGLVLIGIITLGLFGVRSVLHLFPVLFLIGLVMTPMQSAIGTVLQTSVDQAMMGRVGAASSAIIEVASLISMFSAGILADRFGIRTVFLFSGIIVSCSGLLAALIFSGVDQTPAASSDT